MPTHENGGAHHEKGTKSSQKPCARCEQRRLGWKSGGESEGSSEPEKQPCLKGEELK